MSVLKRKDKTVEIVDRLTMLAGVALICITASLGFYFNYKSDVEQKLIEQKMIQVDKAKKRKVWERPMEKTK